MNQLKVITTDLAELRDAVKRAATHEGFDVTSDDAVQVAIKKLVSHAKTQSFEDAVSAWHQLATGVSDALQHPPKDAKATKAKSKKKSSAA